MSNATDYPLGETIHFFFTSRAFATGVPGTLSASTVAVYEDSTVTPIQTAVAVTEDFNSITGLNMVPIVAISGNGYEAGKSYHVVLESPSTVGGTSVAGEVVAHFSIARSAAFEATQTVGYLGSVWLDDSASNTNVISYTDGVCENPVSTLAAAKTIADNLNMKTIRVASGTSVSLLAAYDDYEFIGTGYTITLNGQSVSGTSFFGATIAGNDDGSNTTPTLYRACSIGSSTLGKCTLSGCQLTGDMVFAQAADYYLDGCYSGVAGTSTPSIDLEAAAETKNLNMRHYSGGIEIKNHGAGSGTHTTTIEGEGQVVLAANCAGGTVAIRGNMALTNNGSGMTISDGARVAEDQNIGIDWGNVANQTTTVDLDSTDIQLCDTITTYTGNTKQTADHTANIATILTDTGTTLDNHLTDIKGTGFAKDTHSLTDIEAYVDVLDDATSGNAKIATDVAAVLVDTNELQTDDVPGLIAALNNVSTAEVLTQVNAALDTAITELGVAAPTATPTLRTGLMLLYMALRNKTVVQTSGTDALEIYNNAGTKIAAKAITDDGSDYTEAEMA